MKILNVFLLLFLAFGFISCDPNNGNNDPVCECIEKIHEGNCPSPCTGKGILPCTCYDPECEHNWEWVVITPATTEADGLEKEICSNCNEIKGTRPIEKIPVVEAKYRFNNGNWFITGAIIPDAVTVLGDTVLTVSGGGVDISLNGVYTKSDKIFNIISKETESCEYLYDSFGKIGVVYVDTELEFFCVAVGKSSLLFWFGLDVDDVQNDINGISEWCSAWN